MSFWVPCNLLGILHALFIYFTLILYYFSYYVFVGRMYVFNIDRFLIQYATFVWI